MVLLVFYHGLIFVHLCVFFLSFGGMLGSRKEPNFIQSDCTPGNSNPL